MGEMGGNTEGIKLGLTERLREGLKQQLDSLLAKNNLVWIFGLLICGLIIAYALSYLWPAPPGGSEGSAAGLDVGFRIREIIGFVCGIASVFGIALALWQNVDTKDELAIVKGLAQAEADHEKELSEALEKANADHSAQIQELRREISKRRQIDALQRVANMTRELIRLLSENEPAQIVEVVIWSCTGIIDDMMPVTVVLEDWGNEEIEKEIAKHIKKIRTNRNHFFESKKTGTKGLLIDKIIKDFNEFLTIVVKLRTKLNETAYGATI